MFNDETFNMIKDWTWGVYGYSNDNGEIVYVGIDGHIDEMRRHKEHLKPSKSITKEITKYDKKEIRLPQIINTRLASGESLHYIVLGLFINKELAYEYETLLINKYHPIYNEKRQNAKE